MIANLFDVLFGCSHKNTSFPITARSAQGRSEAASVTGTYVVCLDCGKEFAYDWQGMKVVPVSHYAHAGVHAALESYAGK
jgi:predicted transcriptional regulator